MSTTSLSWWIFFQEVLEGEALHWFSTLPAAELADFEKVVEKFYQRFSHMIGHVPKMTDLIAEKMKIYSSSPVDGAI